MYLALVGGSAALETTQIEAIEDVEFERYLPECLWTFRVRDFGPLFVAMDAHGRQPLRGGHVAGAGGRLAEELVGRTVARVSRRRVGSRRRRRHAGTDPRRRYAARPTRSLCWRPSTNRRSICAQKAGRSDGLRLDTTARSTTVSRSTQWPPALRMSVFRLGYEVIVRPRDDAGLDHGPGPVADDGDRYAGREALPHERDGVLVHAQLVGIARRRRAARAPRSRRRSPDRPSGRPPPCPPFSPWFTACTSPSWIESRSICGAGLAQGVERLPELGLLDSVGEEDGDPLAVQLIGHGILRSSLALAVVFRSKRFPRSGRSDSRCGDRSRLHGDRRNPLSWLA